MTLEVQWVSAVIGGRLDDAPPRAAVPGATLKNIVASAHSKVKAKAVAEAAKATARAKVRETKVRVTARKTAKRAAKGVVKREVESEDDHGLVRQAELHPPRRGMARPRAEDRLLRIRRKYACYTPKGRARRVTKIARSYTTQRAYFTKPDNAETGLSASSRTGPRKVYLPRNRSARS